VFNSRVVWETQTQRRTVFIVMEMRMKNYPIHAGLLALLLLGATSNASAIAIEREYTATTGCGEPLCGTSGGIVTFTDLATDPATLQITFDNTTLAQIAGTTDTNSAVITGIVFDISEVINNATVVSFVDGDNNTLTGWQVEFDTSNNITPGGTKVDISFTTTNGINGGIYNAADQGSDLNGVFPDIATLVLEVTDPNIGWNLEAGGISNDILRMQRVGANGGSLKIPGVPPGTPPLPPLGGIPTPAPLALIGIGGLLLAWNKRRA
jgi:hypothetical protein